MKKWKDLDGSDQVGSKRKVWLGLIRLVQNESDGFGWV